MNVFTFFLVMTGALNKPHTDKPADEPADEPAAKPKRSVDSASNEPVCMARASRPTGSAGPARTLKDTKLPTYYPGISTDELVQVLSTAEGWYLKTPNNEQLPFNLQQAPDFNTVQLVDVHTKQPEIDCHVTFEAKLKPEFFNTPLILGFDCKKHPEELKQKVDIINNARAPRYGCMVLTKDQITALHKDKQLGKAIVLQNGGEFVDDWDYVEQKKSKTAWQFGLRKEEFGLNVHKTPRDILQTPWLSYKGHADTFKMNVQIADATVEETSEKEKPTKQTSQKDTSEQETSNTMKVSVTQTTKVEAGPKSKTWVYASDPDSKALLPPVRGKDGDLTQIVILKFDVLSENTITLEASTDCVVCTTSMIDKKVSVLPCAHTLCPVCVAKIPKESDEFPCPMCRRRTSVHAIVNRDLRAKDPTKTSAASPAQAPVEAPVEPVQATSKGSKRTRGKQESTAELRRSSRRTYRD